MDLTITQQWVALVGGALAIAAVLVTAVRWVRPRWRRLRGDFVGARDALLGRDAVRDSITGREIEPALPGVGVRLARQEDQMEVLTNAVAKIAESHVRLEDHERRLMDLEQATKALQDATVERVVTRAESAQAWRAMTEIAKHSDVVDVDPED